MGLSLKSCKNISRSISLEVEVKTTAALLRGAAIGAVVTYIADPTHGKRRRAVARDAVVHLAKILRRGLDISVRDSRNRLTGVLEETKRLVESESIDDRILEDRVRTAVGRSSSHPNVEVIVEKGCVTLLGPVVDREEKPVLKAARSIRGVVGVNNRMRPYKPLDTMPTQQPKPEQLDIMHAHWAPATRVLVGAVGAALIGTGVRAGGLRGVVPRFAGLALILRSATNTEFKRLVGVKAGPGAVDIQKTIKIFAPVERVYSLWTDYENFPLFTSRIHGVHDLGNGRSHWVAKGPLGSTLEWDAEITEMIPNKLLAWKSVAGSLIQNAGIVRFDAEDDHTRVHIRLSYNPPAGAIGHLVASLLGSNPKQEMDEDLLRMKTYVEIGKRPHDVVRKVA
jgi:uncharacterized membrane protein/osmotically-inducible protein OsmY